MPYIEADYLEYIQSRKWQGPLPPGVTANLDDPPSRHKYGILCQAIFLPKTTFLVVVRIYTRGRISKPLGWDDCEPASVCPSLQF